MNGLRAALLALAPACSFFLQEAHQVRSPPQPPTCDDGYGYPVLDGLFTIGGLALVGAAGTCDGDEGDCFGQALLAYFVVLPAAVTFAVSAIYGIRTADDCALARDLWEESVRR